MGEDRPIRFFLTLAVALALPAVAFGMGGSDASGLGVRPIASGLQASGGGAPQSWLARSDEQLRESVAARIQGLALPPEPAQPAIDYGREVVVGVMIGQRPTGGYRVEVSKARLDGSTLVVVVREIEPAPGEMTIQVLTSPWALVAVDLAGATVDRVAAEDERGKALGTRDTVGGPATR